MCHVADLSVVNLLALMLEVTELSLVYLNMQEGRYYLAIDAPIWHAIVTQTSVSIQTSFAK
jgi:hypothetical protein